jgi:hypothetical protein
MHAITDGVVVAVCGLRRREIVLAYRAFSGGHPQRARHPSATTSRTTARTASTRPAAQPTRSTNPSAEGQN